MYPELGGQTALVTGAASGIGRAISARLSDEGVHVVGLDVRERPADDGPLFDDVVSSGELVVGDVSNGDDVDRAVERARENGTPTVAVNNAGVGSNGRIDEIDPDDWRRSFGVHVDGTFNVCRRVLPEMADAGDGSVVNLSSMWGLRGFPNMADYGAAKGAIRNMTRQLATDFSPEGVRVNAVAPGFVKTNMNADVWAGDREPREGRLDYETATTRTLVPWLGEPEDVAAVVAFLVSDEARFITGQTIPVDGGWTAW